MKKTSIIVLSAIVAMTLVVSCGDDPTTPAEEDNLEWPDMTSMDDVVDVLLLTYANPRDGETAARYNALLHPQYFFELAPSDVELGDPSFLTRAEDIAATEWIFTETTRLELTLFPLEGTWGDMLEVEGEACPNCHVTERQYLVRAQFGDESTIFQSPVGRVSVTIIVAPDVSDASKWVIRAMYDQEI
ncbi:MAG: hypothetical protein KAU49_02870 [Candidatus Krumholzibacteria bacterium]|nr:hypothetical protein [Candidatus Krumholzibacteria bacterium]